MQRHRQTTGDAVLAALLVCLMSGCAALEGELPESDDAESAITALVDVAGLVQDPQTLELDQRGLSLAQALGRAGGAGSGADRAAIFVALRRIVGVAAQTHYIPLSLVEHDIAGQIHLAAGDHVVLVDWKETALSGGADEEGSFSVGGMIQRPGTYQISIEGPELLKISDIHAPGNPGNAQAYSSQAELIMLTRARSNLRREHYWLPLSTSGPSRSAWEEWLGQGIQSGDIITYTQMDRIPLVLTSLLQPALDSLAEAERRLREASQQPTPTLRLPGLPAITLPEFDLPQMALP